MKIIIFTRADGTLAICRPAPWARRCSEVTVGGQQVEIAPAAPFDQLVRRYGTADLSPVWVETEEEFVARIQSKDVPLDAITPAVIDDAALPADRSKRAAWRQSGASVVVDATIASQIDAAAARVSADENERLAAKGDAKIMALVNATPAQLVNYARNNFPSLSLAEQNEMAAILYALAVAVRPEIR